VVSSDIQCQRSLRQELRDVEIWSGGYEFALVSFDGLVKAFQEHEARTERYRLFDVVLKEKFAIGEFGADCGLNEEDYYMKTWHVDVENAPEPAKVEATSSALQLTITAYPSAPGTLMDLPTELHL
jgi:hypothetical protein